MLIPRRGAGGARLDHHSAQAGELPRGVRRLRPGADRALRRAQEGQVARRPGIVRNRLKVDATIGNARAYLRMRDAGETLAALALDAVGGAPRRNDPRTMAAVPARTAESDALSKTLLGRGFKFVGSTIVYAWMQATGVVDDHLVGCFRKRELERGGRRRASSG
jgi:DNA-3-methyladenine glycosylase I